MLRWSKLDGPSTKVGTRNAIYVWTPKSWSFNKLHKVGDFPTRFTLSLKAIKWYGLFIGGHERPRNLVPKIWDLMVEIYARFSHSP